ncbi:MAG: putative bifunctional diguanylate cyclase/phosphodiesterase [Hyphomicrobiales bacterium]
MPKLGSIVIDCDPVQETAAGGIVYDRFRREPDTLIVAVLSRDGRPVGLIERHSFMLRMAAEFGRALFARRPVSLLMDANPLIVDAQAEASEFMRRALLDRPSDLLRGFIVTDGGHYLGVGTPIVLLRMISDENQRRADEMGKLAEGLARMAHRDALTDLPNRVAFRLELENALRRRQRAVDLVGVLCVDLDNFKSVNDTLGHPAGDALLQAATERLKHCVRAGDTIARLGGDEFAVVQTGLADPADAGRLAGRIVAAMSEPFELQGHQIVIGASIGMAIAPNDGGDPDELLKKADMALYRAKNEGRNGFHFFEPGMDEALRARRLLETDLRQALVDGAFELHYQPLFDLSRATISCCEALIRWRHPERGLVPPGDFIPLAEETGIIVGIGEWVLRQACAEAARWPDGIKLAVNISPAQFRSRNLVPLVISALANAELSPRRLELEITENVLLNDTAGNIEMLYQLRDLGVQIAMDDFGTGYSSLGYLRDFPFDKIKIDRSFVRDLHDPSAKSIVKAVTGLATALGIATTAEGVETVEQLEQLRNEGCDEVQGFLISKPRLPDDLATLAGWPEAPRAVEAA